MKKITINQLLTKHDYTQYIYPFYNLNFNHVSDLSEVIRKDELDIILSKIVVEEEDLKKIRMIIYKRFNYEKFWFFVKLSTIILVLTLISIYVSF